MRKYKYNTTTKYILYIVVITILFSLMITIDNSYINNNVSALDYSSNVDIGFTFNPTLSVNISSSDLVISNLKPGTTEDSNSINVSVATNAAYGYNLSATVGSNTYNNTSLNNINSSDNNDNNNNNDSSNYAFNSIATNADLPNLTTNNTWGYSYKLSNDSSWSNYSGLPLFSSSNNKTLLDKYTESEDIINFKIAAKASNTQPSGTYSNVINFNAVSYAVPMSLADSYAYFGAELYHGYYKMQDMTTRICQTTEAPSELQVIDVRDDKVYWIAKLADGNCWMTQNLDLDLTSNPEADNYAALTSENTDLNDTTSPAYQDGYTVSEDGTITWVPERDTIIGTESNGSFTFDGWENDYNNPYSADIGKTYINESIGNHGLAGNYYNWPAVIASNDAGSFTTPQIAPNSICPAGWRMPDKNSLDNLIIPYPAPKQAPNYYILAGYVWTGNLNDYRRSGYYHTSENHNSAYTYKMIIFDWRDYPTISTGYFDRYTGFSVRCLAR